MSSCGKKYELCWIPDIERRTMDNNLLKVTKTVIKFSDNYNHQVTASKDNDDQEYQRHFQQFTKATSDAEPEEMRRLFIAFVPLFIDTTTQDIRIAVNTREAARAALSNAEEQIALHGGQRRYRKEHDRCEKFITHVDSLFERIKLQIDHWDMMRVMFNVTLREIVGDGDALTFDSRLCELFPELYRIH